MPPSMPSERPGLLATLFPAGVFTAEADLDSVEGTLYAEEEILVRNASDRRHREFRAGRLCARQVLSELGFTRFPLLSDAARAPMWPPGIIGSISHTADLCGVVAARRGALVALGLDLESVDPLPDELWDHVLTEGERTWLRRHREVEPGLLAKLIFSAKECTYKCQYTLTHRWLEFEDVEISLDMETGEYHVTVTPTLSGPFPSGATLGGRFRLDHSGVKTGMALMADHFPREDASQRQGD